ncbi:MAG: hypothetical protein PHY26_00870 [Bacilli bacterium]|jgi:hypothetical protein|nr:hypothetical protein [Bacilli bacterium]
MQKKIIYFILTDTGTVLNRLIKLYTHEPFNHVSICLDKNLKEVYSFGRKKHNNPFIAGFVHENINNKLLKRAKCIIYALEIDNKTYKKIKLNIKKFDDQKEQYKYNALGLFSYIFNKEIERTNKYFCSQFVATILKESGLNVITKSPSLTRPGDFIQIKGVKLIYQGKLGDYQPFNE